MGERKDSKIFNSKALRKQKQIRRKPESPCTRREQLNHKQKKTEKITQKKQKLLNQPSCIRSKNLYSNSQQHYTEKFTHSQHTRRT